MGTGQTEQTIVIVNVEVVGAVIVRDGLILCAQRAPGGSQAGLWEFPGGKVEGDETHAAALVREITEELGCQIEVGDFITSTRHSGDSMTITLHTYFCSIVSGEPVELEHHKLSWFGPDDLMTLKWAPADIPTVERIQRGN